VEAEKAEREPKDTFDLETAAAEAIAACDGDPVAAVKSLIVANNFLLDEVERFKTMVSTGYSRGALQMRHLPWYVLRRRTSCKVGNPSSFRGGLCTGASLTRWVALTRFLDDGRVCMSNNAAEREIRPIAMGRNNWTFAGSDAGGERAAAIYTSIQTAKLNDVDPQAWLADILARLQDHPARRIGELLPWNWKRERAQKAAA
jgi:hypothetical protein